ncbi:molybdenum cofactor biosynthesis protein MoaE [Iodidimonas gelatinilytica]|uniref:Molybdopterin synthase catalytic subunit n=2 Tax=Iodidimonas gelatinilytica TaxID=1236966 RepID=A0A5A7MS19_9PROT|nr:molybdenum cofactor biosynthesis protein MoaE [Iodidimonas gelatinilytica]GER01255.1 molybdenum cofactor biosynthesis protein MoaE [Iodidimonas gelatinilytica]
MDEMAHIRVQKAPFDVAQELAALQKKGADIGALVSFTGLVREFDNDRRITKLTLEHYPAMTERQLHAIAAEAETRFSLVHCQVIHRFGPLHPGDPIVLVITAARHRKAAFEGAEFLMDWLKTKAPFWKKEESSNGSQWVAAQESDDLAAQKWTAPTVKPNGH